MYLQCDTLYRTILNRRTPPSRVSTLGAAILLLLFAGYFSNASPNVMASGPQPWAQRPPTVDPTYGLPMPAHLAKTTAIPSWIWTAQTSDNQTIYLRRSFTLKTVPPDAVLYATADNHLRLFINGKKITSTFHKNNEVWQRARKAAVAGFLRPGQNIIAVCAKNDSGAAGVLVWVTAGKKTLCRSRSNWRVAYKAPAGTSWTEANFDDAKWSPATVVARYTGGPWGNNVTPWPTVHTGYLAHLYFQPMHVTVLHGRAAFKGPVIGCSGADAPGHFCGPSTI